MLQGVGRRDRAVNAEDTPRHVANWFAVTGINAAPVAQREDPGRLLDSLDPAAIERAQAVPRRARQVMIVGERS